MSSSPIIGVHWFEPVVLPANTTSPVELKEVFPCPCGATHPQEDEHLFRQHNCFHDGKLHFIQDKDPDYFGNYSGAKLTCSDCGKVFGFEDTHMLCPVCGWMERAPKWTRACPSCGNDHTAPDEDVVALRAAWIATGPLWWSESVQEPQDWRPMKQLHWLWKQRYRGISLNGKAVIPHRCIVSTNVGGPCKVCGVRMEFGQESHDKDGLYCPAHCPQHGNLTA